MNGFEQPFTGKRPAVNDVERAGIKNLAAGVLHPKRAQRTLVSIGRPEGDFLSLASWCTGRSHQSLVPARSAHFEFVPFGLNCGRSWAWPWAPPARPPPQPLLV